MTATEINNLTVAATTCDIDTPCAEAQFCDITENICKPCKAGCSKCKTEEICGRCDDGKWLTIYGVCEEGCLKTPSAEGQYCKDGIPTNCGPGITSACRCGWAKECASCASGKNQCETCLPGFYKEGADCHQCLAGYEKYEFLCLLIIPPEGKCNTLSNSCKIDTFCPASDATVTDCMNCDDSIIMGQGCNCEDKIQNINCQTCAAGKCSKCISRYGLKNDICEPCSQNCLECSESSICTKCDTKFYIENQTCEECGKNCQECSDNKNCTICDDNFMLIAGACEKKCNKITPCAKESEFCDLTENVCKTCKSGCLKCKNEQICGHCEEGKQLSINGVCEENCSAVPTKEGQYCKNGIPTDCGEGLTSQCKCGVADNCASCNETKDKCETCLPGFKKEADKCIQCDADYEKYETLCLPSKLDEGMCSSVSNRCKAGTFCPAIDTTVTDCKNCDNFTIIGLGCNCVAYTPTLNCQSCASGSCSECISGYFLSTTTKLCEACSADCSICSSSSVCTSCKPGFFIDSKAQCSQCVNHCITCQSSDTCTICSKGFKLVKGTCAPICSAEKHCVEESQFCDMDTLTCKQCETGCLKCKNQEICGGCDKGQQLNISGICENDCSTVPITDGNYCKDGKPTICSQMATSQCKCGTAQNCASCNASKDKCDVCLQGFKKEGENCIQCDVGYEKYETLCLKEGDKNNDKYKLSGWAITGIVIAVLVVVAGVAGGLAYYFIKKGKAVVGNTVEPSTVADIQ